MEKYCGKCDTSKDIGEFSKNHKKKEGLSSICKKCHSIYRKNYYKENRDKEKEQVRKYQKTHERIYKRVHPNKKSGRTIKSKCYYNECSTTVYVSKNEEKQGYNRFCSLLCSNKSRKKSPFIFQLRKIKMSAISRGREFELTLKFIEELFKKQGGKCALTNVPLKVNSKGDCTKLYETASLDRIDSNIGYTKDNVQWVLLGINYMKKNYLEEDLHKTLKLIINNYVS